MDKIIGIDIGGSHISGALVETKSGSIVDGSFYRINVNPLLSASEFLESFNAVLIKLKSKSVKISGVAISVPGPFDYENGIFKIKDVGKFSNLFGLNLKQAILSQFSLNEEPQLSFLNDATAYLKGEIKINNLGSNKILGITLGTGFGSSFFENGKQPKDKPGIPANGFLFDQTFMDSIADDYFSTRWFVNEYKSISGNEVDGVKELRQLVNTDPKAQKVFEDFGKNLANFLQPFLQDFQADVLLIGGNIASAKDLFLPDLEKELKTQNYKVDIVFCEHNEKAAIAGAASQLLIRDNNLWPKIMERKTEQYLLPKLKPKSQKCAYDIYPAYTVGPNKIKVWIFRACMGDTEV